jgi:hypothetical protein
MPHQRGCKDVSMMNMYGYNNTPIRIFHDDEHAQTLNEQEAAKLVRGRPHMPLFNALVALVLRSPLHGLLSHSVMLLSVTGRKSGTTITTPVNYIAGKGEQLYILSERNRTWWKNLDRGAHVTLRLRGQDRSGFGRAIANKGDVVGELVQVLRYAPAYAEPLHIRWNDDGSPNMSDVRRAAQNHIVVSIHLN